MIKSLSEVSWLVVCHPARLGKIPPEEKKIFQAFSTGAIG
jgi:hypothetical protein